MDLKKHYVAEDLARYQAQKAEFIATQVTLMKALAIAEEKAERFAKELFDEPLPRIAYIELLSTGPSIEQNFSIPLVTQMINEGFMEQPNDTTLLFKVHVDTLKYTILREPGTYCLGCHKKLPSDASGELARLHIAREHKGEEGVGYEVIKQYECKLDPSQHAAYSKGV